MNPEDEREYERLGPFEIKDKLIALALDYSERMMLNAGRGNPNWLALAPREAFVELSLFALEEARRGQLAPGMGAMPQRTGIDVRWHAHARLREPGAGITLLNRSVAYARDVLGLAPESFVHELADAALGAK